MIAKKSGLKTGLPKQTESLCPECSKIITANLFEKDGKVMIEKECSEHGRFSDVYWSDAEMYLKAENFAYDGVGVEKPLIPNAKVCPNECGLCQLHTSHTALANVDLTNRCNLRCPICFANANQAGYVYEPSFDVVVRMLKNLRSQRPVATPAVQFSGGEPTIYPKFIETIAKAKELGFSQIQVATNGIKFAKEPELLTAARDAGLNTIYLQFDGLRDEIYMASRGVPLVEIKKKVIENVRKLEGRRPSIVFVPTVVKGINNDQVGEIFRYAVDNIDVVRGINFQPVAFTGRIDQEERSKQRYTLPDLVNDLVAQTNGRLAKSDFFPVPSVVPVSSLVSALLGEYKVTFTTHPHCGLATYMFVKDQEHIVPLTRFVDVEPLFKEMFELAEKADKSKVKFPQKVKAYNLLRKYTHQERAPEGMDTIKFLRMLNAVLGDSDKKSLAEFSWDMMFIGGMHFQDNYNYDIERVKRCAIHYTTPDDRIIPFCAYNGGPTYRTEVEKKFSVPIEEWRKTRGTEFT
ncbi:MAG TPA: radical SAM protein [Methanomassiliicoccales archaeon]|nr:radical SAM protein [Methanomassiliicoccales archaeon]